MNQIVQFDMSTYQRSWECVHFWFFLFRSRERYGTLILAANIGGTTFATVTIPTTVPFFSLIGSCVVFHMAILTLLLPP